MGCYVLLVIVIGFLRWNLASRNKAKDRLAEQVAEARDEGLVHAFDDLTDREVSQKPQYDVSAVLDSQTHLLNVFSVPMLTFSRTRVLGTSFRGSVEEQKRCYGT